MTSNVTLVTRDVLSLFSVIQGLYLDFSLLVTACPTLGTKNSLVFYTREQVEDPLYYSYYRRLFYVSFIIYFSLRVAI